MFWPITGSAHGPNHPTARLVNHEVFSLAWAKPSIYTTGIRGLHGLKRLTNSNWEILLDGKDAFRMHYCCNSVNNTFLATINIFSYNIKSVSVIHCISRVCDATLKGSIYNKNVRNDLCFMYVG